MNVVSETGRAYGFCKLGSLNNAAGDHEYVYGGVPPETFAISCIGTPKHVPVSCAVILTVNSGGCEIVIGLL